MRRALAVAAGVALFLPAFVGSASAEESICDTPVVADVKLTSDLDCPQLRIEADGVTVNLARHTINGTIFVGANTVTIRGGTVTAARPNVIFIAGADALLKDLTVSGGTGFAVEAGEATTIRRSDFVGNPGIAVDQFGFSNLLVEDSVFKDNGTGVAVQRGTGAVIRDSKFNGNQTGVRIFDENFSGASDTQVLHNTFADNNVGVRVDARAAALNTLIDGNRVKDSAASGILVTSQGLVFGDFAPGGARGTIIRDNDVTRSGSTPVTVTGCRVGNVPQCSTTADDGITVLAPADIAATMVVHHNHATKNVGYGIEAPGVTDGGRNDARKNGAGGCLGVFCR